MTDTEFLDWLRDEETAGRMTLAQRTDLARQMELFRSSLGRDDDRRRLPFRGRIVGYVAGKRVVADKIHELLDDAKRDHPGSMIYFEPIGFDLA